MATKQTFFKLCWTKHPDFSSWIAIVKDDNNGQGAPSATLPLTFKILPRLTQKQRCSGP